MLLHLQQAPSHAHANPYSPYTASSYTWLLPYHLRQRALVSLSPNERLRHKLSLLASGQDITIAAVGGSTTHCQGTGTQRAEECWVGRLQQLLRDHIAYVDATAAPAAGAAAGGGAGGGGGGHGTAAGRQGAKKRGSVSYAAAAPGSVSYAAAAPGSVSYAAAAPGTEESSGARKLQAAAAGLGRAQVVNCAVPNTTSAFAAACAQLLVPDNTDIVVVEYAVDDPAVSGALRFCTGCTDAWRTAWSNVLCMMRNLSCCLGALTPVPLSPILPALMVPPAR